ncbi:hypothetical protein RR48_02580 [Papilio machaon]|uniref:Uncharacterized protein n=1 Tax=Papilio machaon TaxID=76193 RepID=A0A0N1IJ98_PAPMA|nr:hypothetical protein RR48_02580 [Papilio machaon]
MRKNTKKNCGASGSAVSARPASARPGASPLAVNALQPRATSTVALSVFNFVTLSCAPHCFPAYKRLV